MLRRPLLLAAVGLLAGVLPLLHGQTPQTKAPTKSANGGKTNDVELVERLLAVRKEYQITLENLRAHYLQAGDIERARLAEDELLQFHRLSKPAYNLGLDVPPPTLKAEQNIPEANELIRRALTYKDKGFGFSNDYVDNQRRAELLLQKLLSNYPQSDKIDEAAYLLGDIYESKAYKQYDRAAKYYEQAISMEPKDAHRRAAARRTFVRKDRSHSGHRALSRDHHDGDRRGPRGGGA